MLDDCVFCRELKGSRDTNFAIRYPEFATRIISETDSLVAFPCIGQLVKGHFLVVPRKHDCTFAQTNLRVESLFEELSDLLARVHQKLGYNISESLFFEHGALNENNGGCGIYHAHLHVVPTAAKVKPKEIFQFIESSRKSEISLVYESISSDRSYVLAGSYQEGFYQKTIDTPLPSQTLRRSVANALNIEQWDWKNTFREQNMISLIG